jgi:hypothetical protein
MNRVNITKVPIKKDDATLALSPPGYILTYISCTVWLQKGEKDMSTAETIFEKVTDIYGTPRDGREMVETARMVAEIKSVLIIPGYKIVKGEGGRLTYQKEEA